MQAVSLLFPQLDTAVKQQSRSLPSASSVMRLFVIYSAWRRCSNGAFLFVSVTVCLIMELTVEFPMSLLCCFLKQVTAAWLASPL